MLVDHTEPRRRFVVAHTGRESRHAVQDRLTPSRWQYDYLVLRALRQDVEQLLALVKAPSVGAVAIDIGSLRSPYKAILETRGYQVRTLDLTTDYGADYAGSADNTGRPDASVDLVLCTQVLEHVRRPWFAMQEFHRILKPGGQLLVTIPHIWFYHPHPGDYWRVTQEGIITLCEDAGFRVREARTQGGTLCAFGQIVNFLAYGVLGGAGAPVYGVINVLAGAADRIMPNDLFALNMACLAEKPS